MSADLAFRGVQLGRGGQMDSVFVSLFAPRGSGPTIAVRLAVKVNEPGIEK